MRFMYATLPSIIDCLATWIAGHRMYASDKKMLFSSSKRNRANALKRKKTENRINPILSSHEHRGAQTDLS